MAAGDLPTISVPDVDEVINSFGSVAAYQKWLADVVRAAVVTKAVAQMDADHETVKENAVNDLYQKLPDPAVIHVPANVKPNGGGLVG